MNALELRGMIYSELEEALAEAKEELFNLRFQLATNQLDNTTRIRDVRRDVSRIRTVMREQEIAEFYRPAGAAVTERARRQVRVGIVVSDARDKTVTVEVVDSKRHPKYGKTISARSRYHAHDQQNDANVGDTVRIVETRPTSKTKRWRVSEIVERAR